MASAEVCVNGEVAKDHLIGPGGDADIKEKTTLDDKQTDSPGKAAVTMETASGGSPAKPTLEPAEPSEEAFNDIDASSVASSESVLTATTSTSLATNAPSELVLTEEIIKEEQKWEKETAKEEEEETLRRQKLWAMMSEDSKGERYARLQFLLSKSNMYTEYLLERMESQKKEEKQRRLKTTKRKDKEDKSALSQDSVGSTNIPNSPAVEEATEKLRSPRRKLPAPKSKSAVTESVGSPVVEKENDSPDQNKTETDSLNGSQSSRRGRKRKGTEENTKSIVNFLQPGAKRTKTDEKIQSQKKKDLPDNLEPMIDEDGTLIRPALMTGGDLRKYQIEGLNWLKVLYENGVNGILADEMGLGKTVQCIALIAHLGYNCIPGPFMVVAPLSTLPNWRSEFNRFCPQIPVLFYHGTPEERANLRHKIRKLHAVTKDVSMRPVVITSYEMTMRDRSALKDIEWRYLIVDEGHRIKNWQCKLVRELKQYKNTHRLLLTGTPLQNNLSELWSLLNFLLPEIFDDLGSFESWFDIAVISEEGADEAIVEAEQRKNILSMLHQILTPFMLRRVKTDVDLMIPPKKELIVYAPMTKEQQEFYTATVDRTILQKIEEKNTAEEKVEMSEAGRPRRRSTMRKVNYKAMMESENDVKVPNNKRRDEEELESWVHEMWEFNNTSVAKEEKQKVSQVTIRLQNIMMQLRKCCNHPYLLEYPLDKTGEYKMDEELVTKCGKMLILDKMLAQLKNRGHKVLIFSQMTKMLDILQDFCEIKNLKYCRLDGSCSVENRHEQMQSFNTDPSVFVFLLSTRAGGLGINLMAADTVIIYDSDWNPQCDLQAQDRCHRIGQTRPVVVYRFVTADTIDQRIVERAAAKRKLEKMVIHKGKFKTGIKNFSRDIKPLSPEELMALLKSRDHCREINQGSDAAISDQELDLLLDRSDLYEEFERTAKRLGAEIKVDVKKAKGKKKANNKKKPEESNLFKVIDFTDGGSTLEAKTDSQSDEQTDSQTEVKMDTDDSRDSQKQSQEIQDHKLDVPVNA